MFARVCMSLYVLMCVFACVRVRMYICLGACMSVRIDISGTVLPATQAAHKEPAHPQRLDISSTRPLRRTPQPAGKPPPAPESQRLDSCKLISGRAAGAVDAERALRGRGWGCQLRAP